ncbi:RibD family protein [Derxia lacustris]|uniref:RibD family protein n=1 Tax=Derxia lacustris TaxID=764842 RepID=UPI001C380AE2|nr:RibD family protein [Derxia lacustris]
MTAPAPIPLPRPLAMTVDRLWPLCLAIADARRNGATLSAAAPGLRRCAETGWQLDGARDAAAQALFELFKPLLDRPADGPAWVIGQLGQSLDGCVATRSGDSCFVNGAENIVHLHRLRALSDAVLVGGATVVADDPQLTTRRVAGPSPVRVLLDPALRLAGRVSSARLFTDGQAATLWLCDARWRLEAMALVGPQRVLAVPGLLGADGQPQLALALAALKARGLPVVFVEGGGITVSRFLVQGCLDRLHIAVAPVLIGDGRPGLSFAGPARLADCPRPPCRVFAMGPDQLWDLDLAASRLA